MKLLSKLLCIGTAFLGAATAGNAQELLMFDDLPAIYPTPTDLNLIPNGYGGLNWNNFGVIDGLKVTPDYGYYTGVVSPPNVAFNEYGDPASISVSKGLFDLDSAYLTAALNLGTPLNIQVQGFVGTTLLYNNTYTVNNSGPTLVNFDYLGVNRVTFTSSPAEVFAMDNLTVTVPEPGTCLLISVAAALGGFGVRRRLQNNSKELSQPAVKLGKTIL